MKRRNIFGDNKLTFKNKNFWKILLIPSSIITIIICLLSILNGNTQYLIDNYKDIIKGFFALSFIVGIIACAIDGYWIELKKFMKEDKKGKIIGIAIFLLILFKEIFQALRSGH
ncbi:hypothetical protein [Clostridium beijerinckii]|uniref:hypothetical protein n=1 Tax=Clostridium beijerinckii TaxID=1520 RepID=UPI0015713DC1|nr:hypothetical protein [Clostridium beijerinckii]NRT72214.1 hypothetical protein [Clostridium beijerinckii]